MFSVFFLSFGFLACFSLTEALYCSNPNYPYEEEFCDPNSYQEPYCCGFNYDTCCYTTYVARIWWFWFLLVLFIVFFSFMIGLICRRRRLQHRRTGYVVVGGQNVIPGSVVTTNNAQIAQVAPAGTSYPPYYGAAPPYQGYQNPGGESAYGCPPPYAPPNAPPAPTQENEPLVR